MKAFRIRRNDVKRLLCMLLAAALCMAMVPATSFGSLTPDTLKATLHAGESVSEHKVVHVASTPPKADIVFAFDCTGSMGDTLDDFEAQANAIMNDLKALPGTDFTFGVTSHKDYPNSYDSYGYASTYGDGGDYAYRLDQGLTADTNLVASAIATLEAGGGADEPEDYTRILYESYADSHVGWRPGARRIIVDFGDTIPHDNNLDQGLTAATVSTGGDPGRDEIMMTADDLDLQSVLASMSANGVTLLRCTPSYSWDEVYDFTSGVSVSQYWDYWSGLTGGSQFEYDPSNPASFTPNVVDAVTKGLTESAVSGLHLELSPGYSAYAPWLASVSPNSASGATDKDYSFDVTYTVPPATPYGEYVFKVRAVDDAGVSYGEQTVDITVAGAPPAKPDTKVGISVIPTASANATVTWTVTEANTGDTTLTSPYVNINNANTDAAGITSLSSTSSGFSGDNGNDTLDPGETWTWAFIEFPTASEHYWAFGHGFDPAGADISVATGHADESADAKLTVLSDSIADTKVSISSNPPTMSIGGQKYCSSRVTWTVTEMNTGDVVLSCPFVNVNKTDVDAPCVKKLDGSSCGLTGDTNHNRKLDPGETWKWTFSENPTAGEHYWAFGHGKDPSGQDISAATGHPGEKADATLAVFVCTKTCLEGPSRVNACRSFKLTGSVTPCAAPGSVTVASWRLVGKKWVPADSWTVALVRGSFCCTCKPTVKGSWRFCATYSGATSGMTTYNSSVSGLACVSVK